MSRNKYTKILNNMELTQTLLEIMREFNRGHMPEKKTQWCDAVTKVRHRLYVLRDQIERDCHEWQENHQYTEAEKGAFWIAGDIPRDVQTWTRNWWAQHGWIYDKKHPQYDPNIVLADELYQNLKVLQSCVQRVFDEHIADAVNQFESESRFTSWWKSFFQRKRLV